MKVLANILSVVFHPLLMVTYGVALAFASTYLAGEIWQRRRPGTDQPEGTHFAVPALCRFDRGLCLFPAADADAFLARGHPVRHGSRDADGYGY